jgi:hypothetical protein
MDIMIKLFENEQVGKKLLLENNYKWPFFLLKYQSPTIIQGLVFLYVVAFYNIIFVFFTWTEILYLEINGVDFIAIL